MAKNVFQPRTDEEREFKKVLESIDYSKNSYEVFTDWIQCCALAYAQVSHYTEDKEQRYLKIMNKYGKEDRQKFAELMAILIRAYTNKDGSTRFGDILGDIYMACGFGNSAQGQFFTPFSVCRAMAQMQRIPEQNKIITVMDCAVGGGALPIAYAEHLHKNDINYQMNMLLHATDVSINSVCMCMIQCSLLGIPAIITHGNSITLETWEVWETPMVGINLVKERLKSQQKYGTIKKITTEKIVEKIEDKKIKEIVEAKQLEFDF